MPKIQRLTLFKIPDPSDVDKAIEAYKKVGTDNQKDGKPYIVTLTPYKLHDDPRSQGYTLAARVLFSSLEDMNYYDNECVAHGELKTTIKSSVKGGPPLTLYMDFE